jgi:hypothetical protein
MSLIQSFQGSVSVTSPCFKHPKLCAARPINYVRVGSDVMGLDVRQFGDTLVTPIEARD